MGCACMVARKLVERMRGDDSETVAQGSRSLPSTHTLRCLSRCRFWVMISGEDSQKVEGVLVGFVASKGCARMVARKLVGRLREDGSEKVAQGSRLLPSTHIIRCLSRSRHFWRGGADGGEVVVRWWCGLGCYSVDVFLVRQQRKSQ